MITVPKGRAKTTQGQNQLGTSDIICLGWCISFEYASSLKWLKSFESKNSHQHVINTMTCPFIRQLPGHVMSQLAHHGIFASATSFHTGYVGLRPQSWIGIHENAPFWDDSPNWLLWFSEPWICFRRSGSKATKAFLILLPVVKYRVCIHSECHWQC